MVSHAIGRRKARTLRLGSGLVALCFVLLLTAGAVSPAAAEKETGFGDISAVRSIVGLELRREGSVRTFDIVSDGPVIWTSFRDGQGRLVVELPNAEPTAEVSALELQDELVRSAVVTVVSAGQRPMSQLVVDTVSDISHAVVPAGDRLIVEITPIETPDEVGSNAGLGELEIQKAAVFQGESSPGTPVFGPAPSGVPATQLQGVDVTTGDETTTVWIAGDGAFYYGHFPLTDPYRFVVDLIGVVNTSPVSTIAVQGQVVDAVRVAQYKPQPELVSRVVIDLVGPSAPSIEETPEGLKLTFTHSTAPAVATAVAEETMVAEPVAMTETETVEAAPEVFMEPVAEEAEVTVEAAPAPADDVTEAIEEAVEMADAELADAELADAEMAEPEMVEPEMAEPEMAEPEMVEPEMAEPEMVEPEMVEPEMIEPEMIEPVMAAPEVTVAEAEAPALEEPMEAEPIEAEEEAPTWDEGETEAAWEDEAVEETIAYEPQEPAVEEPVWEEPEQEVVWEEEPVEVAEAEPVATWQEPEMPADAPTWDEPETEPASEELEDAPTWEEPEEEPLPEIAPSGSLFDVSVDLTPEIEDADASSFDTRDVTVGIGRAYTGEPMTLSLQDADVKDVLRSFAQISGLNVVVQPGVVGSVTIEFTDVPWDQALDLILKTNGLDYELEGNIMRVAPISVLRQEAEERARLEAAKSLSIPLKTILRRVSYAGADEIASILRSGGGASLMSDRGSVLVDGRTNTLIIKELPSHINTVIAVIENLDIPEPQVMIEARIIETTKRFSQTLGIQLGFSAISSAERGNTTGLQFPNNGTADGGVNLLTGGSNGFLDITLGNVLNTFNLDALLQAAESEGLINILSAPRITTLNNEQASIQSGLQIPIQTIANNTVSVQFVNATLRLEVTPHVTAEGTVLMDIDIQKREPQLAFAVVGASNAPISTKDATTRVIVRDGGTTVIGGIYKVTSDQGEDRVPGLANVPIIKHLFKNKRRNDENEELLIFITPRVVKL